MASSTTIRLALSIGRGQGSAPHVVAAALSTSSAADSSSSRLLISSSNMQNRSHHHHQASSSSQLNNTSQWINGLNQMNMNSSLYNSYNQSIVSSDRSRLSCDMRWFSSSKTDEEEDQSESPSTTQQQQDDVNASTATSSTTTSGSSQHNTWVEFQRSIAVTGFETGQTVREQTLGKKSRGGKVDRKRKEREAELEAALRGADTTQVSLCVKADVAIHFFT